MDCAAPAAQCSGIDGGDREFDHAALAIEPVGLKRMAAAVRTTVAAVIEQRAHRGVHRHARFAQDRGGVGADTVAAGAIDLRRYSQVRNDCVAQREELRTLERIRKVACEAVELAKILLEWRIDPGVEVNADLGRAGGECGAERRGRFGGRGYRVVDQEQRCHAELLAERLEAREGGDGLQPVAVAPNRRRPVEFLFGVDGNEKSRRRAGGEGGGQGQGRYLHQRPARRSPGAETERWKRPAIARKGYQREKVTGLKKLLA